MKNICLLMSFLALFLSKPFVYSTLAAQVAHIEISQEREYVPHNIMQPGQVLHGHVSLKDATASHTVCLLWRDAYGRIAGTDTVIAAPPLFAADFSIPLLRPLSFYNRIEATLDGTLQAQSVEFRIRPEYRKWDDYYSAVWAHYEYEHFPTLRRAGINTHMVYKDFPYFEQVTAAGFDSYVDNICWRVFAPYHKWRHRWNSIKQKVAADPYNTSLLVRIPSFEDPATDEAIRSTVQQIVKYHSPHRPIFFNLADEIGIGDQSGVIDFDHSVFARNAFMHYLEKKYGSVEAMNRQWDSDFDSYYEAASSTATLTDAAMDRIWEKELVKSFANPRQAGERFGVTLASFADYVALNARLKSTPPKSADQIERRLRSLARSFDLGSASAKDLANFAEKFHEWTTSLSVPNPADWNLSPWMDHKDFMDQSMARALGKAYRYAKEIYPEGVFGFTGGHSPGAFAGYNMEYLSRVVDLQVPYNLACDVEILRSLNKEMILLSPTWGTDERGVRTLWYQFFHNDHGVIFWDNDEERNRFIDKATGELTDRARVFKPDLEELTSGIGKLILGSERLHDRIAILYSHPSIRVHWMIQHLGLGREWTLRESWHEFRDLEFNQLRTSLTQLIEDHFLQYDFVSYKQLEQGILDRGEYDLLFLPQSIALSEAEARAVERFVASGGKVVADFRCALMDQSGKARNSGALDRVFGIRSLDGAEGQINRVEPAGARPVRLAGVPVYLNRFGKGKAIYLNRSITAYFQQRLKPGTDTEFYSLFGEIFKTMGIKPAVRVTRADGSRLPGTELVRYSNGEQEILALFKNAQIRNLGIGGTGAVDNSAFEREERVRLHFPEASHVYDIRGKQYLGSGSSFTLTLDPWRPVLLTVSPQKINSFYVSPSSVDFSPGETVSFAIDLGFKPALDTDTENVVNVQVLSPDKSVLYHYCQNVCFHGSSTRFSIPFSVSDPKGEYSVFFTHLATGLTKKVSCTAN